MDDRYQYLQAFIALGETLSFSKAASIVGISQPTISRQIKALEDQLKCPLVLRDTHSVALTKQGKELFNRARPLVRNLLDVLADMERQSGELAGTINIGTQEEIGQVVIMDLILSFQKRHPKINFQLLYLKTHDSHTQLRAGSLDFVITSIPFTTESIVSFPLFQEEAIIVTRKQNPKNLEDLRGQSIPFVLYREDDTLLDALVKKSKSIKRQQIVPVITVNAQRSMIKALLTGNHYAIVPYHCVMDEIKSGKLRVASSLFIRNRFYLSHHYNDLLDRKSRIFKKDFMASCESLQKENALIFFKQNDALTSG